MDVWPVGLSTGSFCQESILGCVKTIKSGGFDLIESIYEEAFSISQNPRSDFYANAIRNFRELPCDDAKSLSPLTACQSRRGLAGAAEASLNESAFQRRFYYGNPAKNYQILERQENRV
jgi:hypothetical protein